MNGARLLLIGVTYKANLADRRESPAMDVIRLLEKMELTPSYHDPLVDCFEPTASPTREPVG